MQIALWLFLGCCSCHSYIHCTRDYLAHKTSGISFKYVRTNYVVLKVLTKFN